MTKLSLALIEKLPKTDLHVHLDGSMRITTLIELVPHNGGGVWCDLVSCKL